MDCRWRKLYRLCWLIWRAPQARRVFSTKHNKSVFFLHFGRSPNKSRPYACKFRLAFFPLKYISHRGWTELCACVNQQACHHGFLSCLVAYRFPQVFLNLIKLFIWTNVLLIPPVLCLTRSTTSLPRFASSHGMNPTWLLIRQKGSTRHYSHRAGSSVCLRYGVFHL